MPYASNQGVRIHYEVEGNGPPLVIQHGGNCSLEDMRHWGWSDGLKDSYRLVLLDMRGHGRSDKPHETTAYEQDTMARDVVAVLDREGVPRAHYLGYSGGGRIGFAMAKVAPQRLISLIIGGMHPYGFAGSAIKPFMEQRIQLLRKGIVEYYAAVEAMGVVFDAPTKARRLANDADALAACFQAGLEWPSLEDILPTMKMPCLVFTGDRDALANPGAGECVKHMPNARFVSLPGLDHGAAEHADLVLPHVRRFLAEVTEEERRATKGETA